MVSKTIKHQICPKCHSNLDEEDFCTNIIETAYNVFVMKTFGYKHCQCNPPLDWYYKNLNSKYTATNETTT